MIFDHVRRIVDFVGPVFELDLVDFAWEVHLSDMMGVCTDDLIFFYRSRWMTHGRWYGQLTVDEFFDVYFTRIDSDEKFRFIEYNMKDHYASLVNFKHENIMELDICDYIPLSRCLDWKSSYVAEMIRNHISKDEG